MDVVAFDTETELMNGDSIAPEFVCLTYAERDEDGYDQSHVTKLGEDGFEGILDVLFSGDHHLVGHAVAYDLTVLAANFPELMPNIFQALEDGRIHCTRIREKLINLGTSGHLNMLTAPDGSKTPIFYSLADLEKRYLGVDRSAQKTGEDIWRTNYFMLKDTPISQWPKDAIEYAEDDASGTLRVYYEQDKRNAEESTIDLFKTEALHVAADFCLRMITCEGFRIDPVRKKEIEELMASELSAEKLELITHAGIFEPPKPPEPYANGAKDKETGLPKMKKAKPSKINKKKLESLVEWVCNEHDIKVKMTPADRICANAEVITDLAPLNKILAEYQHFQKQQKIVTTELPRMGDGTKRVHFFYDVLKETGRTSSFADKRLVDVGVCSANGQNIDPRVRDCYVADPGKLLCSVDYSGLELVTEAQTHIDLFGSSALAEIINKGWDPHAYLGAQIAAALDPDFKEVVKAFNEELDTVYKVFMEAKTAGTEGFDFWKKYRTMAKPTGLGYPGGLGVDTFRTFAKTTYGVVCDEETAKLLKQIWFQVVPEAKKYFEYINLNCSDPGRPDEYVYRTPMGMRRAGASYCAACNGKALQSPAAEGAKLAIFAVARACYDETVNSPLFGSEMLNFVHDEIITQIDDDEKAHDKAFEQSELMVASMKHIIRDVEVRAEPALMRRWDKGAETVLDSNGRLTVWEPE